MEGTLVDTERRPLRRCAVDLSYAITIIVPRPRVGAVAPVVALPFVRVEDSAFSAL